VEGGGERLGQCVTVCELLGDALGFAFGEEVGRVARPYSA
jgi:hypothetical protein